MAIDGELWMVAEERAQEILNAIQPVFVSDKSRNEIIDYVQTLIKDRLGIEVRLAWLSLLYIRKKKTKQIFILIS